MNPHLFLLLLSLMATMTSSIAMAQRNASSPGIKQGYLDGADGVRIFYRVVGNGDPVVFLHGGPGGSLENGGYSIEPLARNYQLIMYDQRGGGRSQVITDPALLTAQHHVRDVEAVRRHFGIQKLAVIGLSWGAGLAALYADAHSDRVTRIVFAIPMPPANQPFAQDRNVATRALLDSQSQMRLKEIATQLATATDSQVGELCREQLAILSGPELHDRAAFDSKRLEASLLGREIAGMCSVPPAAIRNQAVVARATLTSLGAWDFRPILQRLRVPALIIEGANTNVPLNATREWVQNSNSRLLLVPNAGHLALEEQPDSIRDIRTFLRGEWPSASILGSGNRR